MATFWKVRGQERLELMRELVKAALTNQVERIIKLFEADAEEWELNKPDEDDDSAPEMILSWLADTYAFDYDEIGPVARNMYDNLDDTEIIDVAGDILDELGYETEDVVKLLDFASRKGCVTIEDAKDFILKVPDSK